MEMSLSYNSIQEKQFFHTILYMMFIEKSSSYNLIPKLKRDFFCSFSSSQKHFFFAEKENILKNSL